MNETELPRRPWREEKKPPVTKSQLLRVLSVLIMIAVLAAVFTTLEPARLAESLQSARWEWILAAAVLNLIFNTLGRAKRFEALLERLPHTGLRPRVSELASLILATRALHTVLPARAGETLRAFQLIKRNGYTLQGVVAALMLETFLEVFALGVPAIALLLVFPPPPRLAAQFRVIAGIAVVVLGGVLLFARLRRGQTDKAVEHTGKIRRSLRDLAQAMHLVNSPRMWLKSLAWTWFSILFDLCALGLCLGAVGIELGPLQWFMVLVVVNVAIAIPATPGSVGVLEAGAVLALSALGVDQTRAMAFAIYYHAVHLVPDTLAGLICFQAQWRKKHD